MDPTITKTMRAALQFAYSAPQHTLIRADGGYWTVQANITSQNRLNSHAWERGDWIGTRTVQKLINAGLFELESIHEQRVKLTEKGLAEVNRAG